VVIETENEGKKRHTHARTHARTHPFPRRTVFRTTFKRTREVTRIFLFVFGHRFILKKVFRGRLIQVSIIEVYFDLVYVADMFCLASTKKLKSSNKFGCRRRHAGVCYKPFRIKSWYVAIKLQTSVEMCPMLGKSSRRPFYF